MSLHSVARGVVVALATLVAGLAPLAASAQPAADRPMRIIAAGPPGGSLDVVSRLLAEGLHRELGRVVIVDTKPGGGGAIAVGDLLQSPHDGATMLVSLDALVSEIPHVVKLRFDMARDIKVIAELARGGLVLVGNPALPARTLPQLAAHAKANPGKLSYASYGAGTVSHVMGLQWNKAAGLDLAHVAYKGSPPALADVMGGHVPLMFAGIPSALPLIRGAKVVPYAVSLPQRSPNLPDVPTFAELGLPQIEALVWLGLWIAPDVPAAAQARLREATLKVMGQPAMRDRLREFGLDAGQPRTPDELARSLRSDFERIGAILGSVGFKPE